MTFLSIHGDFNYAAVEIVSILPTVYFPSLWRHFQVYKLRLVSLSPSSTKLFKLLDKLQVFVISFRFLLFVFYKNVKIHKITPPLPGFSHQFQQVGFHYSLGDHESRQVLGPLLKFKLILTVIWSKWSRFFLWSLFPPILLSLLFYAFESFFHANISQWFLPWVWVTENLLKPPELFSVFWTIFKMPKFRWSLLVLLISSPPVTTRIP